jgi:hypothetical protein
MLLRHRRLLRRAPGILADFLAAAFILTMPFWGTWVEHVLTAPEFAR